MDKLHARTCDLMEPLFDLHYYDVISGGPVAVENRIGVLYVVEHGGAVYQGRGVDRKTQEGYPNGVGKADMDGFRVVGDSRI